MFIVFGIMISGVVVGYFLRRIPNITIINKLTMVFIYLLLFFLGISVGANEAILNNLSTIGLQALILTFGAIAGSVILAWILYKKMFQKNEQISQEED